MASRQEVLHAYRHLYKGLLRGVQHAIPARYIVRDQIRSAFRDRTAAAAAAPWDAEAIRRTLWFLSAAGRHTGLEHKILRNLVRMHSERVAPTRRWRKALIWDKKPYVVSSPLLEKGSTYTGGCVVYGRTAQRKTKADSVWFCV